MGRTALLAAVVGLAACTFRPAVDPEIQGGDARGVVISPVTSVKDARAERLATEHCQQQGKRPGLARMVGADAVIFECL